MDCYYCDKIKSVDTDYKGSNAEYDLGSAAPRCPMHWRYVCGKCQEPAHFMSTAYDADIGRFFCSRCATDQEEIEDPFWAWTYYFKYRSPWSGKWEPALDRAEYEGTHPLREASKESEAKGVISQEPYLACSVRPSLRRLPKGLRRSQNRPSRLSPYKLMDEKTGRVSHPPTPSASLRASSQGFAGGSPQSPAKWGWAPLRLCSGQALWQPPAEALFQRNEQRYVRTADRT